MTLDIYKQELGFFNTTMALFLATESMFNKVTVCLINYLHSGDAASSPHCSLTTKFKLALSDAAASSEWLKKYQAAVLVNGEMLLLQIYLGPTGYYFLSPKFSHN